MFPFQFLVGQQPIGKFDELEFQPGDAVVGLFYFTVEQVGGNLLQMVGGVRAVADSTTILGVASLMSVATCFILSTVSDGSSAEFTNFSFLVSFLTVS